MPRREAARHLAVIPARGGSRRIPNKNRRPFAGRPMIGYAIAAARASGLFSRIVVSTDSDETAALARDLGAEVPFRRPADLSDDHTTTAAVLRHALVELGAADTFRFACCIYPATPFLVPADLQAGLKAVEDQGAATAFAVTAYGTPIWRAIRLVDGSRVEMIWPEHRDTRTQDLPETFHDAGQFYWVSVRQFLEVPVLIGKLSRGVVMPRWRSHDIDTPDDWRRAELAYRALAEDLQQGPATVGDGPKA